jgi:hypothetical protein
MSFQTNSIYAAIVNWNINQQKNERVTPLTGKINEFGKTIFLCYEDQKGYWLKELTFFQKVLRWLNSGWYTKPILNCDQTTQIAKLKKLYLLASQSTADTSPEITKKINKAKMEAIFGKNCASVYTILMYSNLDPQKISQQAGKILNSIKMLNRINQMSWCKQSLFDRRELPNNYESFIHKLQNLTKQPNNQSPNDLWADYIKECQTKIDLINKSSEKLDPFQTFSNTVKKGLSPRECLGIASRKPSSEEIKKAYKKWSLVLHPDRNIERAELAGMLFQVLSKACELLGKPF